MYFNGSGSNQIAGQASASGARMRCPSNSARCGVGTSSLDASLVAPDSIRLSSDLVLLKRLLNEMAEDADIIFILSSNRQGDRGRASRPGRIDQAIEVPLPDGIRRGKVVRAMAAVCRCTKPWSVKPCASPRGQRRLTIGARFPST